MVLRKKGERLNRPCNECGKYFEPVGKTSRRCEDCIKKPDFWKRMIKLQKKVSKNEM